MRNKGFTLYPNAYNVSRVDTGVHHIVVRSAENVREVESLLVGNLVRDREQIYIALRYANILGLSASESAREVGVTEESRITVSVHRVLQTTEKSVNRGAVGIFGVKKGSR